MKCCINDVNFIRLLVLSTELFQLENQKYGQILCVHKSYFLMPGHIYQTVCKGVMIPSSLRNDAWFLALLAYDVAIYFFG